MSTGNQLGDYEIIRLLASGGMAEIYLARRLGPGGFEKKVVIKRVAKKLLGDHEVMAMFLDEARVQALLDHPNIVQIYELGEDKGAYFISMEYVPGATLRWVIDNANAARRLVPLAHAIRIIADILGGLHYAHEKLDAEGHPIGLIHRDISPVNILVSAAGVAKICDFGVAKSRLQSVFTQVGIVKGKFRYMSPEHVSGKPVDRRTDVFSVGVVLFEILTGRRLFNQQRDDQAAAAIRSGRYPSAARLRPDLPHGLAEILETALRPEPEARFATAREFKLALEQQLRRLPTSSDSVQLAEYLHAELEGTSHLRQLASRYPAGDLLSGSFLALDPPLPEGHDQEGPFPLLAPSTRRQPASLPSKILAALLLVPSLPFTAPGALLQALLGGPTRPDPDEESSHDLR